MPGTLGCRTRAVPDGPVRDLLPDRAGHLLGADVAASTLWKPFIVVASYVFYAAANRRFCLLLAGITLGNQAAAKLIHRTDDEQRRKLDRRRARSRSTSSSLAVFKYYGFFIAEHRATRSTASGSGCRCRC